MNCSGSTHVLPLAGADITHTCPFFPPISRNVAITTRFHTALLEQFLEIARFRDPASCTIFGTRWFEVGDTDGLTLAWLAVPLGMYRTCFFFFFCFYLYSSAEPAGPGLLLDTRATLGYETFSSRQQLLSRSTCSVVGRSTWHGRKQTMSCQRAKDREMQARPAVIDNRVKTQTEEQGQASRSRLRSYSMCVCACSE